MPSAREWGKERGVSDLDDWKGHWDAVISEIGLDRITGRIPFSKEQIKQALENGDKHLNTLPIKIWDRMIPSVKPLFTRLKMKEGGYVNYISQSECICLLKESAKRWVEQS